MNKLVNNKKKSEILAEKILHLGYGEVLLHQEIEEIIQEKYKSQTYNTIIQQCKKILLKNQRAIESVKGQGYRVVEPDKFVDLSLSHYKKGFKEFQRGTDTLQSAPVKDMTDEGRRIHNRVSDRAALLQANLNGTAVELKCLATRERTVNVLS